MKKRNTLAVAMGLAALAGGTVAQQAAAHPNLDVQVAAGCNGFDYTVTGIDQGTTVTVKTYHQVNGFQSFTTYVWKDTSAPTVHVPLPPQYQGQNGLDLKATIESEGDSAEAGGHFDCAPPTPTTPTTPVVPGPHPLTPTPPPVRPPKPPTPPKDKVCAVIRFSNTFVPNHTLAVGLGGRPFYYMRTTVTAVHGHVRGTLQAKFREAYSYFLRPGKPRSVGIRLNMLEGQSKIIAFPFNHTNAAYKKFFNVKFTAKTNCATTSIGKRRFEAVASGREDRL